MTIDLDNQSYVQIDELKFLPKMKMPIFIKYEYKFVICLSVAYNPVINNYQYQSGVVKIKLH